MALHPLDGARLALHTYTESPFALTQFDSVMLLIVGCAFCVLATFDFYNMDDPYPGYGRVDRRGKTAADHYQQEMEDAIDEIERITSEGLERLNRCADDVERGKRELLSILEARRILVREFKSYMDRIEGSAKNLLRKYRSANERNRSTPPPKYFREPWSLQAPANLSAWQTELGKDPYPIESAVLRTKQALAEQRNRIFTAHDALVRDFRSVEDSLPAA